jgi:hypothetical protein
VVHFINWVFKIFGVEFFKLILEKQDVILFYLFDVVVVFWGYDVGISKEVFELKR